MTNSKIISFLILCMLPALAAAGPQDCREDLKLPRKERIRIERFITDPRFEDKNLEPLPLYSLGSPSEPEADYDHIGRADLYSAIVDKRLSPILSLNTDDGRKNDLYRKRVTEDYERILVKIRREEKVFKKDDYEKLVGLELIVEGDVCVSHSDIVENEVKDRKAAPLRETPPKTSQK